MARRVSGGCHNEGEEAMRKGDEGEGSREGRVGGVEREKEGRDVN